jgi:hypothetical protein
MPNQLINAKFSALTPTRQQLSQLVSLGEEALAKTRAERKGMTPAVAFNIFSSENYGPQSDSTVTTRSGFCLSFVLR